MNRKSRMSDFTETKREFFYNSYIEKRHRRGNREIAYAIGVFDQHWKLAQNQNENLMIDPVVASWIGGMKLINDVEMPAGGAPEGATKISWQIYWGPNSLCMLCVLFKNAV